MPGKPDPISMEDYTLFPSDQLSVNIHAYKLLEISSLDNNLSVSRERWYVLGLYFDGNRTLTLTIEYKSQTTSDHEKETPRVHLVQHDSFRDIFDTLVAHNFMAPVHLDYGGGGHVAMMDCAAQTHLQLVATFQKMVGRFLEDLLKVRKQRVGLHLPW